MGLVAEIEESMTLFNSMMSATLFCDLFRAVIIHISLLFEGAFNHWNTIEIAAITLSTILLAMITIVMVSGDPVADGVMNTCDSDFEKTTCHISLDALSIWFNFISDNLMDF